MTKLHMMTTILLEGGYATWLPLLLLVPVFIAAGKGTQLLIKYILRIRKPHPGQFYSIYDGILDELIFADADKSILDELVFPDTENGVIA